MAERKERLEKNGVVFALWDGKNLQLEVRKKPGNFFGFTIIPGGKVEKSESFEDALLREVKEEYRIEVLEYYTLGDFTEIEDGGIVNTRRLFLVTRWNGELGNPEKINDHIGVPIEKAFGLSNHPLTKTFLDVIQKEIFKLST
jgi:8-oxo-dGTP pyrophosphatase MutT (NUDIX family)